MTSKTVKVEDVVEGSPKAQCLHCGKEISLPAMAKHVRTMHPDKYVPKRPGRKKVDAIEMPPADDVVVLILKALYGDSIPTRHFAHVVVFMEATRTFLAAVSGK